MAFVENLDVFFRNREFSDTVTVITTGRTFEAIFDEAFFDPQAGEVLLESSRPRLTCKAANLEGIHYKSLLEVKGRRFSVISVQPEGTGTASIELSVQTPDA